MKLNVTHGRAVAALAVLSVACATFGGNAVKPRSFEDEYHFYGGVPREYNLDHSTHLGSVATNKRGKAVARDAVISPSYLEKGRRLGGDFLVRYPDLAEGDVAPFFGAIYRVDAVAGLGTRKPHTWVKKV